MWRYLFSSFDSFLMKIYKMEHQFFTFEKSSSKIQSLEKSSKKFLSEANNRWRFRLGDVSRVRLGVHWGWVLMVGCILGLGLWRVGLGLGEWVWVLVGGFGSWWEGVGVGGWVWMWVGEYWGYSDSNSSIRRFAQKLFGRFSKTLNFAARLFKSEKLMFYFVDFYQEAVKTWG